MDHITIECILHSFHMLSCLLSLLVLWLIPLLSSKWFIPPTEFSIQLLSPLLSSLINLLVLRIAQWCVPHILKVYK